MTRKMKDSGVEWIGEIPEDWETASLSKVALIKTGSTPDKQFLSGIGEIDWIKTNNLKEEKGVTSSDFKIKYKNKNLITVAKKGATLVSCIGDIGKMAFLYNEVSYNQQINAVSFNNNIQPKFGFYLLFSQKEQHKSLSNGNVLQILNSVKQGQVQIAYPPLSKQREISEVLDKRIDQIEDIKSKIKDEIKTLEDYKKSVITEAVTKGLDKNVEMKDSGIEWIGEIPKHWKVSKIKYNMHRKEEKNSGNKQVLSVYREYGVIPKDSRDDNHNKTSLDTSNYKYVRPGYLVINKMKAWQGSMGVSQHEGIVSPAYYIYVFTNKSILPFYIHNLLRLVYPEEFKRISGGIREGQWDLSAQLFEDTLIILPPLDEQEKIIKYITKKFLTINRLITSKEKQLFVLEEYKKSLIYEYVTGKKEVLSC